ncbi:hypothetical protein BsWGS_02565 [Bradybaena similaris]
MCRLWCVCLLVAALVSVTFSQGIDLLPSNWNAAPGADNPPKETTTSGPVCTASLDVQTHGNPDCPRDQQYFDIDKCQFVCLAKPTAVPSSPTTQKPAK